jgi:hypothetical protein
MYNGINRAYRIYIGSRNTPNHSFTTRDNDIIAKTVSRYFRGWTIADATGFWENQVECSKVITVTTGATTNDAGDNPVVACANQLCHHFKQYAVMVEEGGVVSLFP